MLAALGNLNTVTGVNIALQLSASDPDSTGAALQGVVAPHAQPIQDD